MSSSTLPDSCEPRFPGLRLMMLITLLTLVVALWYLASHLLRGDQDITWYAVDGPCNLHRSACSTPVGDDGRLRLAIEGPNGIRALEMMTLTVTLEGVAAEAVHVDLVGRDMDMGLHRFPLEARGDGRFQGLGQVPICTEAVMPWRAQVVVETPNGRLGSRFDLDVERSVP
ncbi:hypothetical protein [Billgrantia endophytica]|uniref:YtkA-like domain-containing protein n=1 Tax=Billgrantia endophytica TaxID=2033802 RepID=A0A2N7TUX8_9GAMM|nr:hypothetical protein [Halomonas endophytica]PMR71958.1 hypothetical protein C1H69_22490 [Halomonas endophytica]